MIQVTVGDHQWLVTRRYRQFDEMHELVREIFFEYISLRCILTHIHTAAAFTRILTNNYFFIMASH